MPKKKKKTKGDEHFVHVVIVILTLAHLHFDTLQKVLFQYVRESLYAMSSLSLMELTGMLLSDTLLFLTPIK